MLGDGSISLSKNNRGQGKISMTMDVYSLNYLNHLDQTIFSQFTNTKIFPYPNILLPHHKDKKKLLNTILELEHTLYIQLCIVCGTNLMWKKQIC